MSQADQLLGRRRRIPGREEQTVPGQCLEVSARPGGHYRNAVGHGLDHREPEAVEMAGGQKDRRLGQQLVGIGYVAEELDGAGDAEVAGQLDQGSV